MESGAGGTGGPPGESSPKRLPTGSIFGPSVGALIQGGMSPRLPQNPHLIQQNFWWPSMAVDSKEFVKACSICAHSKSYHRAPVGLLRPLPIPKSPWSHISTGLPKSEGNTTIRTIIDRFSKAVHFCSTNKTSFSFRDGESFGSTVSPRYAS